MSSRCVYRLMAGLAVGWMAIPEGSAQPYVGLGLSRLSLASQYSAIDARSGTGFTLIGGIEFASTGFAELAVSSAGVDTGPTENIFYPADSAEYSILRLGIGKSLWALAAVRMTIRREARCTGSRAGAGRRAFCLHGRGEMRGSQSDRANVGLDLGRQWRYIVATSTLTTNPPCSLPKSALASNPI